MLELTVTSVQSIPPPTTAVTEQPNRVSRWWMRHYRHIGLASSAGSAILMCVIAILVLPIIVHGSSKTNEQCSSDSDSSIETTPPSVIPSVNATENFCQYSIRKHSFLQLHTGNRVRLCAEKAVWKNQGITVAGSADGIASSTGAGLRNPSDLLVDSSKHLFIADSENNRVMFWPADASEGCIAAGTGHFSSWMNSFKTAAAIAVWNDLLYVSDLNNYRLLAFPLSPTGHAPDGATIVGRYGLGSSLDQINYVQSMAVDTQRALFYLSDSRNHRILQFNVKDKTLHLVAGTGIAASNSLSLDTPLGITVDEDTGALYVADSRNHRIQRFDWNSTEGVTIIDGLSRPSGVEIDSDGNVYVADAGNHRVIQWSNDTRQGRIIAGTGMAGASETQLNNPVQLKFDGHQNLYVVDQKNNRIQRFDRLEDGC